MRCRRLVIAYVFTCAMTSVLASRQAGAQRLFGNVVLADERTPAAGAIVAVADSLGNLIARELASARGDYVIPLTRSGTYTISAQQVGSLATIVRDILVQEGQDVRTRVVLSRPAPRPPQVAQRTRGVCDLGGDTTGLAVLWDQFQTALATTELAERSRTFVGTWSISEQVLSANLRDTTYLDYPETRVAVGVPIFPVMGADSTEQLGFVVEAAEGVKYHVPGVTTFRSPGFLKRRCFAFEPAPSGFSDFIGVHFWATGYRIGVTEVEGTVWFDHRTLALRAMTYAYSGLPPAFAAARAGGALRFRTLSTGHWIVDQWTLRVPSGKFQRMFAYDVHGTPNGYGNTRLDGVRIAVATLSELTLNGTPVVRRPQ